MVFVTAPRRRLAPLLCLPLLGSALLATAPRALAYPVHPAPATATATTTVATASAIQPGSVNRSSLYLRATYAVSASLTVDTGVLRVATTITARNISHAGIDRVELNTIAARLGGISITSASVDGTPVSVKVSDQTLIVPLGGVLPDGATAVIKVAYRATLKNSLSGSNWLFTRYNGTIALYRWIPWVSRARPFDRPNHGDPFVTPSSPQVTVNLTLSQPRILAAPVPGLPTTASKTWSFTTHDVRDVAMVLAPDFTVSVTAVDGIYVRAYSRPGGVSGSTLASRARSALDAEAARVGVAYPWPSFTIAETAGGYGMESPGLVWIPSTTLDANLRYLVYHETAHQWFYGLVGNDQWKEPFADEAAADLLARTVLGTLRSSRCATDELDRNITQYSSACYYETIYIQGGGVLNSFRSKMGTTLFWNTVADYVEAYAQKLGGTKQLLDRLQEASPVDLRPTLRSRFPTLY
jgi:Peptidase family M1 domain